jgi:cysteinyl-tRNA synthetase
MSERVFRLYDTLSRTVKPIETGEPGHLKFYSCGPTVYSYAHIGNFRTFLTMDLVVRTAQAIGWKVTYASNITDVGHLTQDDVADAGGEDKMERALKSKEGEAFMNVWDLARYYADAYLEDWRSMNLTEPTVRPRATEHMREQIQAVQQLIEQDNAYETPTGVYFAVDSFDDYGKLSGNRDRDNLQVAVRDVVQDDNKRSPADFALWKKDDKHLMQWFSPWGWGFPGWHIECSVMARQYLGDTIDLHGGGEDLKFPHHECEIAQSESVTHKPFCNHWIHVTFLQVDGEKMSKSKGNFYTVRELVEKGYDPFALRYALISVPYGKPMNFTLQSLAEAAKNVERFRESVRRADGTAELEPPSGHELAGLYEDCLAAMLEDLNTSVAIAKALEGAKAINRNTSPSYEERAYASWFLSRVNGLLGVVEYDNGYSVAEVIESKAEEMVEGKSVDDWVAERTAAKAAREFSRADEIRVMLNAAGIELRDSPEGTTWVKKA